MQNSPRDGSFPADMGVRENRELVLRLFKEGFPKGPRGLDRYYAPGYVDHSGWGDLKGLKAGMAAFREAYPNIEWKIHDVVGEGDKIAVRSSIRILGAVGVIESLASLTNFKIAQGRVVETWGHGDPLF